MHTETTSDCRQASAIIIGCSSDIGASLAERWLARQWRVAGTYRNDSEKTRMLVQRGVALVECDLRNSTSVDAAAQQLQTEVPEWDVLVLGAATMEPIGPFATCSFDAWAEGIDINLLNQLRMLHALLPKRRTTAPTPPTVLMFAGGGTNGAPECYSSYTLAKIASIKMCELLDQEIPDTKFTIIGPGWVRTKIHNETLRAGPNAGASLERTLGRLSSGEFTPMSTVLDCCDWVVDAPRNIVSGRNFSVATDPWSSDSLQRLLAKDNNLCKLRRYGNDVLTSDDIVEGSS